MAEGKTEPSPKSDRADLTVDELVRSELQGKSKALERYDGICWKVRSGYVVVLYGLLTLLGGKDFQMVAVIGKGIAIRSFLYMAVGMSICALFIDLGFLLAKLRVVEGRNRLSDFALDLAIGKAGRQQVPPQLRNLLHLSGEAPTRPAWPILLNGTWPACLLYLATPVVLTIIWAFSNG